MINLKEKLNLKTFNDWNKITKKQIIFYGGSSLLHKYSLYELKSIGFPDGKLQFKLPPKSPNYWDDPLHIHQFLDKCKEKLNLSTMEDWNSITTKQIQLFGGSRLLQKFSLFELKVLACPEGKMLFFNSSRKPIGFWEKKENIYQFFDFLKEKLNLKTIEDWNRISIDQIKYYGGFGLLEKFSLKEIIELNHPDFIHYQLSNENKKSSQRWLFLHVQSLFPGEEIVEDFFHSDISRESGFNVQFDIFLIHRNIAFEYHGKQHYEDIPSLYSSIEMYQSRDKEKLKLCEKYGIQLIVIPYWWDRHLDSLKRAIYNNDFTFEPTGKSLP